MVLVAIGKENRIAEILTERRISIYELCKWMNDKRPEGAKPINYKTVHGIVKSASIPYATHYGNIALIAKVLSVSVDDLEK